MVKSDTEKIYAIQVNVIIHVYKIVIWKQVQTAVMLNNA